MGVLALTMLPLSKQILNWVLHGKHFIGLDGAAPDPVRMAAVLETFGGFLNELYQTAFSAVSYTHLDVYKRQIPNMDFVLMKLSSPTYRLSPKYPVLIR